MCDYVLYFFLLHLNNLQISLWNGLGNRPEFLILALKLTKFGKIEGFCHAAFTK